MASLPKVTAFLLALVAAPMPPLDPNDPNVERRTVNDGGMLDLSGGSKEIKPDMVTPAMDAMYGAVFKDSPEMIKKALKKWKVNKKNPSGHSPLFFALMKCRTKAIEFLLFDPAAGASIHTTNDQGFDALDAASFSGCADGTKMVLKAGANLNKVHADGFKPLHRAIWGNDRTHTETVKVLLEAGASPTDGAHVPGQRYVLPIEQLNDNNATKALLERWIKKEERGRRKQGHREKGAEREKAATREKDAKLDKEAAQKFGSRKDEV